MAPKTVTVTWKPRNLSGKGWLDIGYHYVIRRNGRIEEGRPLEEIGAHVGGHNVGTAGICLVGGVDNNNRPENNFTPLQWPSLLECLGIIQNKVPNELDIKGHNEYDKNKACPSFRVEDWLKEVA